MSAELKASVVVIVYKMARQARNTLVSLSPPYQRDVRPKDYEIIVVENSSDDPLGEGPTTAIADNIRYFRREESSRSPVDAVNFGIAQCRAPFIGLMIDGARMVTPRVMKYALYARRITENALVVVPGYHLGSELQHLATGHDQAAEQALLERIDWRQNGYRLFEIAVCSEGNTFGVFHPFMEANCVFFSRDAWRRIGGAPNGFDLPGGGAVNLYLYHRLAALSESEIFVLAGEGNFHQFHGGVTTSVTPVEERESLMVRQKDQLTQMLGRPFESPKREPTLLGAITSHGLPFLDQFVQYGRRRFDRFRRHKKPAWGDDPNPTE